MEQRGVGDAVPSTHCTEVVQSNAAIYRENVSEEEEWERYQGALLACFQRLRTAGVEPSRYNTVQSAEDAESLRRALGYRRWILFGASYAAQIAIEVAQRHPGGALGMVLDSPSMPQYRYYAESGRLVDEAIERFLSDCEQQAVCREAHPTLRADLMSVLTAIDRDPVTVHLDPPLVAKSFEFVLNRARYVDVLFDALYNPRDLDLLRDAIASGSRGDFAPTAPFVASFLAWQLDETFGDGTSVVTDCREEVARTDPEDVHAYTEKFSGREQQRAFARLQSACALLRAGVSDPRSGGAPPRDIPTLVLAGANDPISPLRAVEDGLLRLGGATLVTFEHEGHYLSYLPCARRLVSMWLMGRLGAGVEMCTEDGVAVSVRHST
jgi:pimeloyl-ACP methyl ester carboxylesterase